MHTILALTMCSWCQTLRVKCSGLHKIPITSDAIHTLGVSGPPLAVTGWVYIQSVDILVVPMTPRI